MSDVSKTNELIAGHTIDVSKLTSKRLMIHVGEQLVDASLLADALVGAGETLWEAMGVSTADATRVPVQGEGYTVEVDGQHFTQAQWEAVQRYCGGSQAVQGEPNDDREALMEAMKRGEKVRQAAWSAYGQEPDGEGTKPHSDNWYRAEALMAAGFSRATAPDARDHLHAKCDCVPDLGPAHCHLCAGEGSPVRWEDCEAVREIADVSEPVEVVLTTTDIEGLAHLLVQLSPATQKNSGATIRRLLREINIKEVGQ